VATVCDGRETHERETRSGDGRGSTNDGRGVTHGGESERFPLSFAGMNCPGRSHGGESERFLLSLAGMNGGSTHRYEGRAAASSSAASMGPRRSAASSSAAFDGPRASELSSSAAHRIALLRKPAVASDRGGTYEPAMGHGIQATNQSSNSQGTPGAGPRVHFELDTDPVPHLRAARAHLRQGPPGHRNPALEGRRCRSDRPFALSGSGRARANGAGRGRGFERLRAGRCRWCRNRDRDRDRFTCSCCTGRSCGCGRSLRSGRSLRPGRGLQRRAEPWGGGQAVRAVAGTVVVWRSGHGCWEHCAPVVSGAGAVGAGAPGVAGAESRASLHCRSLRRVVTRSVAVYGSTVVD